MNILFSITSMSDIEVFGNDLDTDKYIHAIIDTTLFLIFLLFLKIP